MKKIEGDTLHVVVIVVGARGSIFMTMIQEACNHIGYGKVPFGMWRRDGKAMDIASTCCLFDVINSMEDMLRRIFYVEARLGDQVLYDDEIMREIVSINMIETPLCPIKVVTNL
jgi:glycerol-3-phosphate dehydrogenase (NAD+)